MGIESIYGKYGTKQVVCDNCGDGFEAENWNEAKDRMKTDNWKSSVLDHRRVYYCPACRDADEQE